MSKIMLIFVLANVGVITNVIGGVSTLPPCHTSFKSVDNIKSVETMEKYLKGKTGKAIENLTGKTFSRLTAIEYIGNNKANGGQTRSYWRCSCSCGGEKLVLASNLKRGLTTSCGCYQKEKLGTIHKNLRTERYDNKSEYRVHDGMKQRCYTASNISYKDYGARGITVCDEWLGKDGFATFLKDMGKRPSSKHSIERNDNSKGYSKENCKWATAKEQANNRRNNINIEIDGDIKSVSDWSIYSGVNEHTIRSRYARGLTGVALLNKEALKRTGKGYSFDKSRNKYMVKVNGVFIKRVNTEAEAIALVLKTKEVIHG